MFGADLLRRRIGRDQVGARLLDLAQLEEQRVVLRVRYLGLVENVVSVLVAADLLTELIDTDRRVDNLLLLGHLLSGASMPLRIFSPALSNLIKSSSSVRVRVLLTTVPAPKAGCFTRSPLAKRWTGGGAGAASTWRSMKRSLYPCRGGATGALPRGAVSIDCGMSVRNRLGNAG